MSVGARALSRLRFCTFEWFKCPSDADKLARYELFPLYVLITFCTERISGVVERANDANRDLAPTERLHGGESSRTGYQLPLGVHDDRMEQTEPLNRRGEA